MHACTFLFLQESPDRKTYYIKVHGTHTALLKGAEDLLLRMPIEVRRACAYMKCHKEYVSVEAFMHTLVYPSYIYYTSE